jgi:hypothetical protein
VNDQPRTQIVARRFDGLGGRLTAMVNAMAIAERYGLEYRFAWTKSDDLFSNDPHELFAPEYLDRFGVHELTLVDRTPVILGELDETLRQVRLISPSQQGAPFVEIDWPIGLHPMLAEDPDGANLFAAMFRSIPLTDPLSEIARDLGALPERNWVGVHVRAGDVVVGAWRRGTWHQKYQPLSLTRYAMRKAATNGSQVRVVSDQPAIARYLIDQCPGAEQLAALVPSYAQLTPLQQAMADIILLSQSTTIVAPSHSAFSAFAGLVGGASLERSTDEIDASLARRIVSDSIHSQRRSIRHRSLLAPYNARDLVWYVDIFGERETAKTLARRLRRATRLDPEFTAAWARLARVSARSGQVARARRALVTARHTAERDERQDDVAVELDVAEVVVGCCDLLLRRGRDNGEQRHALFQHLRATVAQCAQRQPHHWQGPAVAAMTELVELVGHVAVAPPEGAASIVSQLRATLRGPLSCGGDGYDEQRRGVLDPWCREVTALLLAVRSVATATT